MEGKILVVVSKDNRSNKLSRKKMMLEKVDSYKQKNSSFKMELMINSNNQVRPCKEKVRHNQSHWLLNNKNFPKKQLLNQQIQHQQLR